MKNYLFFIISLLFTCTVAGQRPVVRATEEAVEELAILFKLKEKPPPRPVIDPVLLRPSVLPSNIPYKPQFNYTPYIHSSERENVFLKIYKEDVETHVSKSFLSSSKKQKNEDLIDYINKNLDDLGFKSFLSNGSYFYSRINSDALFRFNETFNRTKEAKWDSKAEKIAKRWSKKLNDIRKSKRITLENNNIYYFPSTRKDINQYLIKDNEEIYLATFRKNLQGNSAELESLAKAEDFNLLSPQANYSRCISATETGDVKYLYLTSLLKSKDGVRIMISFGGQNRLLKLKGTDCYNELLVELKTIIGNQEGQKVVLCLDPYQKNLFDSQPLLQPLISIGSKGRDIMGTRMEMLMVSPTRLVNDLQGDGKTMYYIGNRYKTDAQTVTKFPKTLAKIDSQLILPEKSFTDKDQISIPILNKIQERGLAYSIVGEELPSSLTSNILVFSGNKGDELWSFLEKLGNKGLLQDKILIMYSCYAGNDVSKYSNLITRYNIKGVLRFPYEIDPGAVKAVLLHLGDHLDTTDFYDIWKMATEDAYDDPSPAFILIKEEIKKLINIQYLISANFGITLKKYA